MTRLGYYSPAILGTFAVLIYAVFGRGDYSQTDRVILAAIGVPSAALACQLLMLSAQGMFAGVLPAPSGRTLRGRKCGVIGLLLFAGQILGGIAYLASRSGTGWLMLACAATGAGSVLIALALYGWSLPTASTDFADSAA
jgi:hypothetical protein